VANDHQVHLALELVEQEIAAELPAHMRAFARAHAEGRQPPAAPLVTRLASTLDTALTSCSNDGLFERGLALLRLVAPFAIENDPAVVAARAEPASWKAMPALARARDEAARARFGRSAIELAHLLNGTTSAPGDHDVPGPAVEGWNAPGPALDVTAINDTWQAIAARLGLTGSVRIDRSQRGTPRTFVIEPRVEVIVVVPVRVDTPAARFAVLHELGHAAAALALAPGVPRVIDEAAASYVARLAEPPSWLPPRWACELAAHARKRRTAIAATLDDVERLLPELPQLPGTTPPPALWHDPGAQAAYVAAEAIAEQLRQELGPNPPRGQFVRALAAARDRVDHRTRI
jgi:hypothetical protein